MECYVTMRPNGSMQGYPRAFIREEAREREYVGDGVFREASDAGPWQEIGAGMGVSDTFRSLHQRYPRILPVAGSLGAMFGRIIDDTLDVDSLPCVDAECKNSGYVHTFGSYSCTSEHRPFSERAEANAVEDYREYVKNTNAAIWELRVNLNAASQGFRRVMRAAYNRGDTPKEAAAKVVGHAKRKGWD